MISARQRVGPSKLGRCGGWTGRVIMVFHVLLAGLRRRGRSARLISYPASAGRRSAAVRLFKRRSRSIEAERTSGASAAVSDTPGRIIATAGRIVALVRYDASSVSADRQPHHPSLLTRR